MWAFNEEVVARAIFNCRTPIISAVGHETDVTIADYVADMRAPTPSAAAELAVSNVRELLASIEERRLHLERSMDYKLRLIRSKVEQYQVKLRFLSPQNQIREKRQHLMDLENKLQIAMDRQLFEKRKQMELYIQRMKGLSPLDKLNQGFSFVSDMDGHTIRSISQVNEGDELKIQVTDGKILTKVMDISEQR